jgi:putrescine aminotransferase
MSEETRFWHGFANMGAVRDAELTIVGGQGSTVWDAEGRRYLDAAGSLWYCNVGHGRTEIAEAVASQMRELAVYQTFELFTNRPTDALAKRLAALVPLNDARIFFTPGGGSDAVDTAAKLVRAYWQAVGKPQKKVVLSRSFAYHGMNAYGTSLGGIAANVAGLGQIVSDVEHVDWNSADALRQAIERYGDERVAAFFAEPVIGAGGVLHPPDGYLTEVQEICRAHDVLFVVDEVICGFGRLGRWFGADRFGLTPDLMTVAKGLTSGYVPLGAVVVGERIAEPFWRRDASQVFRHGYTYAGHPLAAAAGLANLDIIEREGLVEQVLELEPLLERALRPLEDHPLVREVRAGIGLLGGVELATPELLPSVVAEARANGVITRGIRGVALQISPPFVIEPSEIEELGQVLQASFDSVANSLA